MKHSKKTLALLAQFPGFNDWIVNNLTPEQLVAVIQSPTHTVWFGEGHPLNSQELAVQLWRAYREAVVFELECRWGEDEDHSLPPIGCDRLAYFHQSVCDAIGLFATEQPELVDQTVQRVRREIEAATGLGQPPTSETGAAERRNRL